METRYMTDWESKLEYDKLLNSMSNYMKHTVNAFNDFNYCSCDDYGLEFLDYDGLGG